MTTPTTPARVDPMPAAELGMWLFVAGEAMFFAGLLSAFLVLQSTAGERALFVRSAAVVNRPLALAAILLLAASSVALWRAGGRFVGQAVVMATAVAFLGVQAWSAGLLLSHHTIITPGFVYDGRALETSAATTEVVGRRVPLPPAFDVSGTMPADAVYAAAVQARYTIPTGDIRADATYGPSRNNYFACYFLVSGAHALHVVGGLVGLAWLAVRTRCGTATPVQARVVALYWQFVNGVGLLAILLLWLG